MLPKMSLQTGPCPIHWQLVVTHRHATPCVHRGNISLIHVLLAQHNVACIAAMSDSEVQPVLLCNYVMLTLMSVI